MSEAGDPVPELSVIVMGYRNAATIVDAVRSILDQASPSVEVLVVTSGGDESAAELRRHLPAVAVLDHPGRLLPGAARNAGVDATRGSIVAFLAADCRAEPGWIAARLARHAWGDVVVAGAVTSGGPARPWGWASYFDLFCSRAPGRPAGPIRFPDPATHGLSYERTTLERIGPFDVEVRVGEDTEAARRLASLDIDAWYEPAVRTAHRGPPSTRALVAEQYRRGLRRARAQGDELRPMTTGRALLVAVPVWARWFATRVSRSWVNAPDQRPWLVASVPWLAAARAAYVTGWYRERVRISRRRRSSAGPDATVGQAPSTRRATS